MSWLHFATLDFAVAAFSLTLIFGCRKNMQVKAPAHWTILLLTGFFLYFAGDGASWVIYAISPFPAAPYLQIVLNSALFLVVVWLSWANIGLVHALADESHSIRSRLGIIELAICIILNIVLLACCLTGKVFTVDSSGEYSTGPYYPVFSTFVIFFALIAAIAAVAGAVKHKEIRTNLLLVSLSPISVMVGSSLYLLTGSYIFFAISITLSSIVIYVNIVVRQAQKLEETSMEAKHNAALLRDQSSKVKQVQAETQFSLAETLETLGRVEELCDTDPMAAADTVEELAWALRKKADVVKYESSF